MGLYQYIKDKFTNLKYAKQFSGRQPIFSQFGDNIYASDIVQSIIDCIVCEMSKLQPQHIRNVGRDKIPINETLQKVLNNPNELMTKSDFMSKIIWNLFLNYNSFIYPVYKEVKKKDGKIDKQYIALYPLQPQYIEMLQDDEGTLFIRMRFKNTDVLELPYNEVIHIRYKYSFNDFLGGNANGQPDNEALLKLLSMNNNFMEGVLNAMKTSFNINGVLKSGTVLDEEKRDAMIEEFNNQLQNNKSGIIGVDGKAEFIQVNRKIQAVDPETLKFIDNRILRNYGVSMPILTGDYTKAQYQAFYQKKLEPLINAISQAFTKSLFTEREKEFGNEIIYLPQALIFLDTTQLVEVIRILGDSGELYSNEKRLALGLSPLEELKGVRMQSLNYINVDYSEAYQFQNKQAEV